MNSLEIGSGKFYISDSVLMEMSVGNSHSFVVYILIPKLYLITVNISILVCSKFQNDKK